MIADAPVALERRDTRVALATRVRWLWMALVAVVALFALGSLVYARLPHTPGENSAEAGFARDMAVHHSQAVEMALMIRDRTWDPAIRTLATDILLSQQEQIGEMQGWLDVWRLSPTGDELPMTWMGHPVRGRMPGMASPEEIALLQQTDVAKADVGFLRLMIRHHEGGVDMAHAILDRSDRWEARRLAGAIAASQESEITVMRDLLARKGAAVAPGEAPPHSHGEE